MSSRRVVSAYSDSGRELLSHVPAVIMLALLGFYAVGSLLHPAGADPLLGGWLALVTRWSTVLVCWLAVRRHPGRREGSLAAAAVTAIALGDLYRLLAWEQAWPADAVSPSDAGYVLFYVLILSQLLVLVWRRVRAAAWPALLDGAVAACGGAAVMMATLDPVMSIVLRSEASPGTALAVLYPVLDVTLAAVISGITAAEGGGGDRRWKLLVCGVFLFMAADVIYAVGETAGAYTVGSWLDGVWAAGLALIALWIDRSGRPRQGRGPATSADTALLVPGLAALAAVAVLLVGTRWALPTATLAMAGATLALAALPLFFRQRSLRRLTRTDELTGLANRRALFEDGERMLHDGSPGRQALLLLDLDGFKEVNDVLGHDAGDRLLIRVGSRLAASLGRSDLLARLGGDEFAIVLPDASRAEAEATAKSVQAALAEPTSLEGIAVRTVASIGVALCPDHGTGLSALLRKADVALYKAKAERTGHHVYSVEDDSFGEHSLRTLEELRRALATDQLVLHYQPKIDLATGRLAGVEVLVRWEHPKRGLLFPGDFLELAERGGLMHDLTRTVLGKALDQAASWRSAGRPLEVAVNVSASSLMDLSLPDWIGALLLERGLPPEVLMLEITEDFLMANRDRAREILTRLRASGIRIAIDDFGTGYSSLAYLRDLPVDELKLDRSFVFPMNSDPRAATLVASTIALAHGLGLRIVAEGVENATALDRLGADGCDQAQGYFISRPVPTAELDVWVDRWSGARQVTAAGTPGLTVGTAP